ncbi:PREDICTED: gametogenetin-binding protein 2 [Thamnophis sirtalis]|uniref:Gametogenetin-binding protein 2 n=1 Tax=Thamnophis sirtalis TaxID=35019 RepID=A0A6I9YP71_9SAUR|nr:PREDICTED: gametogenetin-binding protein 2 [Thamnophis sirtalis]
MARLVAVCRDSEEEFLFERLQIPLYIDDTLTPELHLHNNGKTMRFRQMRMSKLNEMIDAIPKSKKNKRCQLHSLDTHKPKPLG